MYVEDQTKRISFVQELEVGESFGEIALLKHCWRTATVVSTQYSTCAAIDTKTFGEMKQRYPEVKTYFEAQLSTYHDKWRKFLLRTLSNIDFLSHGIQFEILEELVYMLKPEVVGVG